MKFNEFEKQIALERQIRLVLSTIEGGVIEGSDYFQFRCPICGDSKKSKSKKRGYILKRKKPFMYYCHNCFIKMPVEKWLKEFYPAYYKDYYSEILLSNGSKKKQKPLPKVKNPTIKKRKPEQEHTKHFVPILKGSNNLFEKAINLCEERKIPKEVWTKWFVATGGMYKNRLIIPFFDNNGKIYYYQGRSLLPNMEPKYLSRAGDYISIYNYYHADVSKPVVVLEGPIDSIFVENSVAVTGVKIEDKNLKKFPQKRWLIDYDRDTDDTLKKALELLSKGEYVFCWKKFMKVHHLLQRPKWDMNDLVLHLGKDKFTYEELEPFFTNSLYDKVLFI